MANVAVLDFLLDLCTHAWPVKCLSGPLFTLHCSKMCLMNDFKHGRSHGGWYYNSVISL